MKPQSFFVRKWMALPIVLALVFSAVLSGAASAQPLLEKTGLPKPVAAAADIAADTVTAVDVAAGTVVADTVVADVPAEITSLPAVPAAQLDEPVALEPQSELDAFAASVTDGSGSVLRGVYVPGVLALRVVQQSGAFSVNMTPGLATQFSAASAYGVTGLLADNVASGVLFYSLAPGQEVTLIYGDGTQRRYVVGGIARYQALSPTDPYSDFLDLATGAQVSSTSLFNQMYSGGDKITFQTCLAQGGLMSWGRLFVTAYPAQ